MLSGFEDKSSGYKKALATCKHFAGNDFENYMGQERYGFDAIISPQEPSEYYLPPFKTCAMNKEVSSFMCSYNAINGIPMCANEYILETILRKHWGWQSDDYYVVTDCDCVPLMVTHHKYVSTYGEAAAAAIKAGTDLECNTKYTFLDARALHSAWNQSLISEEYVDKSIARLYTALITAGMFDPAESQPLRQLSWDDVNTESAQRLAYQAAVDGIVLIKNEDILPFDKDTKASFAFIGPWVNASDSMQGIYSGPAPYLISPFEAAMDLGLTFTSQLGVKMNDTDESFENAITAASEADCIVYMGGIDHTLEAEARDREHIAWPEAQLKFLEALVKLEKPIVIVQFGGGQLDDTDLINSNSIKALLWAGIPGQSGGKAVLDILFGIAAPAGRLPITQYPAPYAEKVPSTDMNLRPATGNSNLGRNYMWYNGSTPVPFGFGLHYTSFDVQIGESLMKKIPTLEELSAPLGESWQGVLQRTALTIPVTVKNTGSVTSDYVALAFLRSDVGPEPRPLKTLVSYSRLRDIEPGKSMSVELVVTVERLVRVEESGNRVLYPGNYEIFIDVDEKASYGFKLLGEASIIEEFPQDLN